MKIREKHRTPDGLRSLEGPVTRHLGRMAPPAIRTGRVREGIAFSAAAVERWAVAYKWATNTEGAFMNVIEELKSNYEEAEKLWSNYDERLKDFRSAVKNDVSSLEASARKTTEAVQRMLKAYGNVLELLNSTEMQQATENAERLAAAMSALSNLQSHKLTVAVVDNEKIPAPTGEKGNG